MLLALYLDAQFPYKLRYALSGFAHQAYAWLSCLLAKDRLLDDSSLNTQYQFDERVESSIALAFVSTSERKDCRTIITEVPVSVRQNMEAGG